MPEPEEVTLFGQVRTGATQEVIGNVQADFLQVLRSPSLVGKTLQSLGARMSTQDFLDRLQTEVPPLSDFVIVTMEADNPQDAHTLVSTHVDNALREYGNLRAQTTVSRREFIMAQLNVAQRDLDTARDDLLRFQIKVGSADLSRDIQNYQDSLRSLRSDRDRAQVELERLQSLAAALDAEAQQAIKAGDATLAASLRVSASNTRAAAEAQKASISRINELIAQRETELLALVSLNAQYDALQSAVRQAQGNVTFLQSKLNEAQIKESDARAVSFIRIVEPAQVPTSSAPRRARAMLVPTTVASFAGGIILAFILEYLEKLGIFQRRA
jgi:uncharacterized protein involved in exopolysaccharide biosynthesis